MGVLNFDNGEKNLARREANAGTKPKAKVWLNIGYEKNGKFISLPLGMPIDTMEPAKVSGSEDWCKQQTASNDLLKAFQEYGDQLAPGAEIEIPTTIIMKLRRVKDQVEIVAADNEYGVDLGSLFGGIPG